MCSFWLCWFRVVYPIKKTHKKNRLVPSPSRFETMQWIETWKSWANFFKFYINAMPAKTTQKLLSKKEVCVTRTIAITGDNFSFISFPDLSGWRCQNGKCYLYVRDTVTWDRAQQRCRSRNATLVTISSSSENSFVGSLIKTNIWIGLNDRVEAGTWDYIFSRYLLAQIRTQTVIFQWNEELYKMQYEQYRKEMREKLVWCIEAHVIYLMACYSRHTYPDIFESATYPFCIRLPSTCIRWIRHTNPLSRVEIFEYGMNPESFGR